VHRVSPSHKNSKSHNKCEDTYELIITAAHADYTKKALQDGSEFMTKLASLKAPGDVMALQSEYAKTAYEAFVSEAKKISGLYADLAKQTYKPLEGLVAKMTPSHQ
jgi:hypothetical protein